MKVNIEAPDNKTGKESWTFVVEPRKLIDASTKLADYHKERLAYWKEQASELEVKLKESVQVREQQVTGGNQLTAVYDQEVLKQFETAKSKVFSHESDYNTFASYVGVFKISSTPFNLTIEDIKYFKLFLDLPNA